MVAVTSAVIGAPLTTILIVFELTRNYDLTTAAMVSVVFSNLISYRVFAAPCSTSSSRRGLRPLPGPGQGDLDHRPIESYVTRDFYRADPGDVACRGEVAPARGAPP